MPVLYAGKPCIAPLALAAVCREHGLPDGWAAKANTFDLAGGEAPGTGWILLRRKDLDAISLTTDNTLKFFDDAGNSFTFQKITLVSAECITPANLGAENAAYLCKVVDRRFHLARVPCNVAYNVRSAVDATGAYLTQTLNAGTAYTWSGILQSLWTTLGLGTIPTLPFTPDAAPENLCYWGGWAWAAANDVLTRIGCAVRYWPVTDTFTFVQLGATDAASDAEAAQLERKGQKTWDGDPIDPVRSWRPDKIRVTFQRAPLPTDGSSPFYVVDVTLDAEDGVESGSFVQLADDASALGATGTPSNSAALYTRANERAADWWRKRSVADAPKTIAYEDFQKHAARLFGSTRTRIIFDERGASKTELFSAPDGALEKWRPLTGVPKWWPPGGDGGGSSLLDCSPLASLEPTACLSMTVVGTPTGRCEDVDPDQVVILDDGDEDSVWTGDVQFVTDTGSHDVEYDWPAADPTPTLSIGGVPLRFLGCTGGKFRFLGYGTTLCGALPDGVCADNSFIVEIECVTCPNPDYDGAGWYCRSTTGCGEEDVQTCVEYLSDPGPGVTLCSGPHETEEDCEGVCAIGATVEIDCGAGPQTIRETLVATCTGGTGDYACHVGTAIPLVYNAGLNEWAGTVASPCGCDVTVILEPCSSETMMTFRWGTDFVGGGTGTAYTNPPFAMVFSDTDPSGTANTLCSGTTSVSSSIEWTVTE